MLGKNFYHQSIRKYVAAFGTIFNNISVRRTKTGQTLGELVKVPLSYSQKQKYLQKLARGVKTDEEVGIVLPRMSFELTGLSYDSSRKLVSTRMNAKLASSTESTFQYVPVPYNFDFSLNIYATSSEDATQIVEQILPYFAPEFTVSINMIPEMGIVSDTPVVLNSVSYDDSYEGSLSTSRMIVWSMSFTLRGNLYPDVRSGKYVTKTLINLYGVNETIAEFIDEFEPTVDLPESQITSDYYQTGVQTEELGFANTADPSVPTTLVLKFYKHYQNTASDSWLVEHNLGTENLTIDVVDYEDNRHLGFGSNTIDENNTLLLFSYEFTGTATLYSLT